MKSVFVIIDNTSSEVYYPLGVFLTLELEDNRKNDDLKENNMKDKKQDTFNVSVGADVRRCVCDGLGNAIIAGIERMQKEHAPKFVIEDYIYDMISGGWENCTCDASKND